MTSPFYIWFHNESIVGTESNLLLTAVQTYQLAFASEPWNESFSMEEVLDTLSKMSEDGDLCFAIVKDEVIGIIGGYLYPDEKTYYLDEFTIHPKCQGKGYGTLLLEELIDLICPNVERIILMTSVQNTTAMNLYIKFGFISTNKSELHYQMRPDGQIKMDERILLYNDFHLNRVVILKYHELMFAIVFDRCHPFIHNKYHSRIQKKWPITTTCFIGLPYYSYSMARFSIIGPNIDITIEGSLNFMTSGKEYTGFYELNFEDLPRRFTSKKDIVSVLYDGNFKLNY